MTKSRFALNLIQCAFVAIVALVVAPRVSAQQPTCETPYLIDAKFDTGAAWQMCWEWRPHEGIVLSNVAYQAPGDNLRLVLKEAAPAELHVSYDNGSVFYFDVSAEGLGLNHQDLSATDCPTGTRFTHPINENETRSVLCYERHDHGPAYRLGDRTRTQQTIVLFSISRIDMYEYIYRWTFHDDGAIDISVGATGKLVEYGVGAEGFGWDVDPPVTQGRESLALSHVHTYWFKLDFDIDGAQNDTVEEFNFDPQDDRLRHRMTISELTTEVGRPVAPERWRFWRVKDSEITNADGNAISYRIEPNTQAIYRGIADWDWTNNDFYVTVYKPCERWLINNAQPDCASKVTEYVDGEATLATDVVVWYGSSFHHVPRSEDEDIMPLHWDGFHVIPHDWSANNVSVVDVAAAESPPVIDVPTPIPPIYTSPSRSSAPVLVVGTLVVAATTAAISYVATCRRSD